MTEPSPTKDTPETEEKAPPLTDALRAAFGDDFETEFEPVPDDLKKLLGRV